MSGNTYGKIFKISTWGESHGAGTDEKTAPREAPLQFLLTLGYAGWEAGQLEQELAENSWLAIPADPEILFNTPTNQRWEKATEQLGFDIWKLGPDVGHA